MDIELPDAAASASRRPRAHRKWIACNLTAVRRDRADVILHLLQYFGVPTSRAKNVSTSARAGFRESRSPSRAPNESDAPRLEPQKCGLLRQAKTELGFSNVEMRAERVENWKPAQKSTPCSRLLHLADFRRAGAAPRRPGGHLSREGRLSIRRDRARSRPSRRQSHRAKVPRLDAKRHLVFVQAA